MTFIYISTTYLRRFDYLSLFHLNLNNWEANESPFYLILFFTWGDKIVTNRQYGQQGVASSDLLYPQV